MTCSSSDESKLIQFTRELYVVLVQPDAAGKFTCMICGGQNVFANTIAHGKDAHGEPCALGQVLSKD